MFVFGYGSLLWYTNFPYVEAIPGVVHGYVRRFWQLSPDHRGTVDQPGRTVTLVPCEGGQTWGLAYRIPDDAIESTFAYLNFRERAGYRCEQVEFHPDDGSEPFKLHVYISLKDIDNPYHTGPTEMDDIVSQIITCRGRSGTNLEYALRLAECQRRLAPHFVDDHLFDLEKRLLEKIGSRREAGIEEHNEHRRRMLEQSQNVLRTSQEPLSQNFTCGFQEPLNTSQRVMN